MSARRETPAANAGYGAVDVAYTAQFQPYVAPAWLDHVALLSSIAPPNRREDFSWCDLGCGSGVSAVVLAATHPGGRFCGVDMMPGHVEQARALASEAGATNAAFLATDFAGADRTLGAFDYIVAHGVYSWVSEQTKAELRAFIDRHLAPGGLAFVSYNALPGWAGEQAFQRALHTIGQTLPGDSQQRFAAAFDIVRAMAEAGAPGLAASKMLPAIANDPDHSRGAYLAHEYMGAAWRPLWVSEVRDDMASIGLRPAGSAVLMDNYDTLVLDPAARAAVGAMADERARELARDLFADKWFRRDVFVREGRSLDAGERRRALLESAFALMLPPAAVAYGLRTTAGPVVYDGPAARAVVARLAGGPARPADIAADSEIGVHDILASALVLAAVGVIRPVESGVAPVEALNRAIVRRLEGAPAIEALAAPCGTAFNLAAAMIAALRGGADPAAYPGWRDHLAACGVSI